MNGSNIAGGNPKLGRVDNDYYATNPSDTKEFLDLIDKEYDLYDKTILEPAAGQGHISTILVDRYTSSEINSTDLVNRGSSFDNVNIEGGVDFLNREPGFKGIKYDYVITNPPFSLAREFIDTSLEISDKVFIFAKLQFLEGKARKDWFKGVPLKYVYVYSHRANPWRNGEEHDENGKRWSSTMAFAWYVFDKEYSGEPIIRWI